LGDLCGLDVAEKELFFMSTCYATLFFIKINTPRLVKENNSEDRNCDDVCIKMFLMDNLKVI